MALVSEHVEELYDLCADEDEGERQLDADGEHVVVDATEELLEY